MRRCNRCGRPDAPGSRIPADRGHCHTCRRGRAPPSAQPVAAPRPPEAILQAQRDAAQRQARAAELAGMAAHVGQLERELAAVRTLRDSAVVGTVAPPPAKAGRSEVVPLLLTSDWHVEEHVDPLKMHGTNEYTLDIAKVRAETFFRSASKLIASAAEHSDVKRVMVGLLGDFFSGSIHDELMEVNQLGPAQAAAYARQLLSRGIRYLLGQHPKLTFEFYCVGGNHGRMTHKTRIATIAENSLEGFMYEFLASDFREETRAKFFIAPGDELYGQVFDGYTVRFIHGDQIGYQGGVGGITIPLNKWVLRANQTIHADLTCLGHFHQVRSDRDWLCNGSLIGPSPYSKRFGFAPERPKQQFALIHRRHGRTTVADVWCEP